MADETISEEWRLVYDCPGHEVSNLGRVRGLARYVGGPHGPRLIKERIRTQTLCYSNKKDPPERRYFAVSLGRGDKRRVHALICEAFHGPRPTPAHYAAHWDGNPQNNVWTNLRWATPAENAHDTIRHGRTTRGEKSVGAVLTASDVIIIRALRVQGKTFQSIADIFGVSIGAIASVIYGDNWSHV